MELRQLVYAEAVARHRHFTRAAEELHVAQSALSHQIRRLEAGARHRAVRAHQPPRRPDRGRARRSPRGPGGCSPRSTACATSSTSCAGLVRGRIAVGACCRPARSTCRALLARFSRGLSRDRGRPARGHGRRHARAARGGRARRRVLAARRRAARPEIEVAARSARRRSSPPSRPGTAPGDGGASSAADLAGRALATPALRLGDQARRRRVLRPRRARAPRVSLESGDPYLIRCLVSDGFGAAVLPASLTRAPGAAGRDAGRCGPPLRLPVSLLWRAGRRQLRGRASAFIDFVRRRRARLSFDRSPAARVAGRDPVADQGRLGDLDRRRRGGRAEELELVGAERGEGGLDGRAGRWR